MGLESKIRRRRTRIAFKMRKIKARLTNKTQRRKKT